MTHASKHVQYTIRPESGGNGSIINTRGDVVAVLEDWSLFVGGVRIGDVDSYRQAVTLTQEHLR